MSSRPTTILSEAASCINIMYKLHSFSISSPFLCRCSNYPFSLSFPDSYPVATPKFIHPRNSNVSHWLMSPPVGNDQQASTPPASYPDPQLASTESKNVRLMRPQDFTCKSTSPDDLSLTDDVLTAHADEPVSTEVTTECSDSGLGHSTNSNNLFSHNTRLFSDDFFFEHIYSVSLSSSDLSDFRRRIKLLFPHKICCSVLSFLLQFAQTSVFSSNHQCFLKQVIIVC